MKKAPPPASEEQVDFAPFLGEGAAMAEPKNAPPATRPDSLTNSRCRALIALFLRFGYSYHSHVGRTLWVIRTYCLHHGIPAEMQRTDKGITITMKKNA